MMRLSRPATLLLSVLLAACASNREASPIKRLEQSGPLKVNPGLLGQPVPAQATPVAAPAQPAASVAEPVVPTEKTPAPPVASAPQNLRSLYFDYKSAELKDADRQALRAHARYLAANPQVHLRIEGNADERGGDRYNLGLGEQRAAAVRAALVAEGAAEQQIAIKSLGKSQPKRQESDEASWAENRRADLIYENEK
ncbi:OmpA family protein [Azonexus sp.]|jgi:peptidoglycan-associated lipoprotein|uniref:OmpA family protein n=1 Tax=Azonexus sp. TaxID=1872668 RepID=UPI00282E5B49|nr:OmpA family protein [Azonexus sp.]MDR1994689.1 OmpA family protein [Azonexus sp.]